MCLRHKFKAIVSRYISFNSRDIVYECQKCKKRKLKRKTFSFDQPLEIDTTIGMTSNDIDEILKGQEVKKIY